MDWLFKSMIEVKTPFNAMLFTKLFPETIALVALMGDSWIPPRIVTIVIIDT
ncbi:hypothetical protein LEP1GSC170_6118, partial [Leptospira interrogans serovar Bataviae str. HAI135]